MLSALNQTNLPVACDEGVYRIAREIQLFRPDEFKNIVLCMGSFHMTKVALGCIRTFLKDSGAQTILFKVQCLVLMLLKVYCQEVII